MSRKDEYSLVVRMDAEAQKKLEQWSGGNGDKSAFVRKAINFYADYLAANSNNFLPKAIITAIDGRLSMLERHIASIGFTQAVAQDMTNGILSDAYSFTRDDLKRRRAESVKNVKQTGGFISLEKQASKSYDEFSEYGEDDEAWRD